MLLNKLFLWFSRWWPEAIMMWTVVWRIQMALHSTRRWRSNMTALHSQQLRMGPTSSASAMNFPPSRTRQFTLTSKLAMTLHSSPMRTESLLLLRWVWKCVFKHACVLCVCVWGRGTVCPSLDSPLHLLRQLNLHWLQKVFRPVYCLRTFLYCRFKWIELPCLTIKIHHKKQKLKPLVSKCMHIPKILCFVKAPLAVITVLRTPLYAAGSQGSF